MQEKEKPPDNADAYREVLTNYCAKISHFKEILPYGKSAFEQLVFLTDCYTVLAARLSRYKNPINDVGVTAVYGTDHPELLQHGRFVYVKEHTMIPQKYIDALTGSEKYIFGKLYAGSFSKKLYRLFEYRKA